MTHTRIRRFNTRDTYPEQHLDNDLCQAVATRGGTTLRMRSRCPQNLDDAKSVGSHDPVEQTHKVMRNICQIVEEAGGRMEHLVKVFVYIADVHLSIRPERMTLITANGGSWHGTVKENIFVGTDVQTNVQLQGGIALSVRTQNSAAGATTIFDPGTEVAVSVEAGAARRNFRLSIPL